MSNDNNGQSLILAGEKEQLTALGHSIRTLLPGADKLSENQAVALGNYASLTKANPFRGEIYGYRNKQGQLVIVDGYKLLIRMAKNISDYDEDYGERLPSNVEGLRDGDIGYRCTIMRDDRKPKIREYVQLGATFREAYDLVSVSAVGIVTVNETRNAPPKGWSWDQVARKRALKNVLNQAYAMPSIEEMAKDSWQVEGQETVAQDWAAEGTYQTSEESDAHARLAAQERERSDKLAGMDDAERVSHRAEVKLASDTMASNGDDDPIEAQPDIPEAMHPSAEFWQWVNANGIDRAEAGKFIHAENGDFGKALAALKSNN